MVQDQNTLPARIDKLAYLEIQDAFFDAYLGLPESSHKLDHDAYRLPDVRIPDEKFSTIYFRSSINDYSNNLINLLNQFCTGTNRIEAWDMVFSDQSRDLPTRLYILTTLINPLLMAWIAAPYVFKQRIAVCTIALLNDYAVISDSSRPEIDETKFRDKWLRRQEWRDLASGCNVGLGKLTGEFDVLGSTPTGGLRHKFVHRYPPEFGYGSSKIFVRSPTGSGIGLPVNAAVPLADIVSDLKTEQAHMNTAFLAFWNEFSGLASRLANQQDHEQ